MKCCDSINNNWCFAFSIVHRCIFPIQMCNLILNLYFIGGYGARKPKMFNYNNKHQRQYVFITHGCASHTYSKKYFFLQFHDIGIVQRLWVGRSKCTIFSFSGFAIRKFSDSFLFFSFSFSFPFIRRIVCVCLILCFVQTFPFQFHSPFWVLLVLFLFHLYFSHFG